MVLSVVGVWFYVWPPFQEPIHDSMYSLCIALTSPFDVLIMVQWVIAGLGQLVLIECMWPKPVTAVWYPRPTKVVFLVVRFI